MRPLLLWLAMAVCAISGLLLAADLVAVDIPVHAGVLHADTPDPDRPGHQRGVLVSTPELVAKGVLVIVLLVAAVWFWRRLPKPNEPSA